MISAAVLRYSQATVVTVRLAQHLLYSVPESSGVAGSQASGEGCFLFAGPGARQRLVVVCVLAD